MTERELTDYELDWSRCEALIKTWPNASNLGPERLKAAIQAYAYPHGRDRAARCNPLELEEVLLELIQETSGERPTPKEVANRLGVVRVRNNPGLKAALEGAEVVDDPVPDFVLAHLRAMQKAAPSLYRPEMIARAVAAAIRHGRNPNPMHELGKCEACARARDEDRRLVEMVERFGSNWRRKLDPEIVAEVIRHQNELAELWPWSRNPITADVLEFSTNNIPTDL